MRGCDVSAVFYMHFSTNHRLPSADPGCVLCRVLEDGTQVALALVTYQL